MITNNKKKTLEFYQTYSSKNQFISVINIYTRQQKKCPVVQITVTSKIFGRFLSIIYQIKQNIM